MRLVCRATISSREARSVSSITGCVELIDPILSCWLLRYEFGAHQRAADAARMTAEFRDGAAVGAHIDVVDPGAAGPRDFPRTRHQAVAELARPHKGDVAVRGHRAFVVRVAG